MPLLYLSLLWAGGEIFFDFLLWFLKISRRSRIAVMTRWTQTKHINDRSKRPINDITTRLTSKTLSSTRCHFQRSAHSCHLITALRHPSVKPLKRSYLALTPAEWEWKFSQLLTVTVVLLQQVPIGCDCSPSLISHQAGALRPTADRISGPLRPAESPRPITMN